MSKNIAAALTAVMVFGLSGAQAGSAAGKDAPQPMRVTVLRFTGPDQLRSNADIGYRLRTGEQAPTETDFADLPDAFQNSLEEKLRARLGKSAVVPDEELQKALSGSNVIGSKEENPRRYTQIAKATRSKYLVTGNVDKIEFHGETVIEDRYVMFVSAGLVSGDTGEVVWKFPSQRFEKRLQTPKGQKATSVFFDTQVPEIANFLSSRIVSALGVR